MIPIPTKFSLVVGHGEGDKKLTAFDAALLDAGIGNMNLLRVSSVLPPGCIFEGVFQLPAGSLLPIAYGSLTSDVPGEIISAAIGVGIPEDPSSFGMIMEFSGFCKANEAALKVEEMVREAFAMRNLPLKEVKVKSIEHKVERCGSVIAACPLFYEVSDKGC
ncbi:MAG: arginine decarboxylase, pyruvoyl-dependent [Acetomicrobium sp.]|jgi:arginine decarboxylase|uniref:pyruvoyl-dependent arginine decarboxylase n=1 Tax=Acetomicrobium TaxID=49894 RepID=UPI0016A91832|nr:MULTISPECIES: arginine decarboxylase, pyruvoyl-dependent [Acetomicrobium]MDI9377351.1 arginine decarboxylase, pyruvoyl-dependent [Synergistota bacterium]NLI43565.1 arginine decarboxylase, pyruvoyl-dependent [Synergistaceae bacterium]MBP8675028.1 arginine decarboxylase, pyruvoyl-dependent [Acetomicrobium sp.]MDR9770895.1 arginine decarboxylase, pyruvoyl-dependent [Acetomicrobium sp.]HOB10119.1 arginine decarboxylase, pyruvoyl-dependent [Acetomicrobium sp.]